MISKEEFVKIINRIKEFHDWNDHLDDVFDCVIEIPDLTSPLIQTLNTMFGLEENEYYGTDIDYFIYELNFGKDYEPGCVTDDDVEIDFSTAETLYDYLIKRC